jgi:branched-chain amino acid transport system ATP-binding protein
LSAGTTSRARQGLDGTASARPFGIGETGTAFVLVAEGLTKAFGGPPVVDGVSFTLARGTITGLIGPNGAGKTTLFAIVSGFEKPTSGRVLWRGEEITGRAPHLLARDGIARTFQIVQPFAGLSVRENIAVGAFLRHHRRAEAIAVAEQVAARVGLSAELDKPAAALTVAGRKRVELAKALATQPKLLLLDEVLAGLNPSEVRDIVPVVRAIRDSGVTVLMIEHVMQAVMNLCDVVHVLAQGRIIAGGTPAEVVSNPAVIEAYLGHGAATRLAGGSHA